MSDSLFQDIGAYLKGAYALAQATITAGAGNDNVAVNGAVIDLWQWGNSRPRSAVLLIQWTTTLAANKSLSIAAKLQDDTVSAFNGTPADFGTALASAIVASGGGGGATVTGVTPYKLPIIGARRYVRPTVTADLSATGTDTVALNAILVVAGFDQLPAS